MSFIPSNTTPQGDRPSERLPSASKQIQVLQGDAQVTRDQDVIFTALLGSCVATCIWDPSAGLGGMNHILLPDAGKSEQEALYRGTNAMEVLINSMIRAGADRSQMRVKLLGGAKMYSGMFDIGKRNAEFAEWFIKNEGFMLVDTCLGGNQGRNVRFWPATGKVQRKFMAAATQIDTPIAAPAPAPAGAALQDDGDVELF